MLDIKTKYWNIKSVDMIQYFMVADIIDYESLNIKELFIEVYTYMKENNIGLFHERDFFSMEKRDEVERMRQSALFLCGFLKEIMPATFLVNNSKEFVGVTIHGIKETNSLKLKDIIYENKCIGKKWSYNKISHFMFYPISAQKYDTGYDCTLNMFELSNSNLNNAGMSFKDVIRTWIYIPNIFESYNAFNEARSKFYIDNNMFTSDANSVEDFPLPASTGIGINNTIHDISPVMDMYAVKGATVEYDNGIKQKSAFRYGSAFSRASIIDENGYRYLFLSGTAAINMRGETVYLNSIENQVNETFDIIAKLLDNKGLSINNCVEATIYIKDSSFKNYVRKYIKDSNFNSIPFTFCVANICRENLLFEVDGVFCKKIL